MILDKAGHNTDCKLYIHIEDKHKFSQQNNLNINVLVWKIMILIIISTKLVNYFTKDKCYLSCKCHPEI